jgi:hypothetical protein
VHLPDRVEREGRVDRLRVDRLEDRGGPPVGLERLLELAPLLVYETDAVEVTAGAPRHPQELSMMRRRRRCSADA